MNSTAPSCDIYKSPDKTNFILSIVIAFGIVFSYIPQYYNIVKTHTSVGLSPTFLFLICVAGLCALSNLILLSFLSVPCCTQLSPFECVNSQVSLIQVGLQATSTLAMPLLCVAYTNTPENNEYRDVVKAWWKIVYSTACSILILVFAFISLTPSLIILLAQGFGISSTVITFVQYIPQLLETFNLKSSGVLSIPMMCIQTPGGFVWTATLMFKPGSNWSTWMPYLAASTFQGILLCMSVYYDYIRPKQNVLLRDDERVSNTPAV